MLTLTSLVVLFIAIKCNDAALLERVVGGRDAPDHKYPYLVSFRYKIIGETVHFCSGSILNRYWILTAGHCVNGGLTQNAVISSGTNYLNETGDEYESEFYVIHDKFVNFFDDDIALVRVKGEIKFSEYVQPIYLVDDNLLTDNVWAIFAGWGSTYLTGPSPNSLQEIDLMAITNQQCKEVKPLITENHICTFTRSGEGTCHGDSGGPLVINGYQVGIASYVTPCAVNDPDVFTRVSKYLNWIQKTMNKFTFVFP